MAFESIESAPRNGELIALLGESGDVFEIARWSIEKRNWVGQKGEPIRIQPTHWFEPNPSWLPRTTTSPRPKEASRRARFGLYAGILIIAASAIWDVPWSVRISSTEAPVAPQTGPSPDITGAGTGSLQVRMPVETPARTETTHAQVQDSSIVPTNALEQERQRRESPARELSLAQADVEAVARIEPAQMVGASRQSAAPSTTGLAAVSSTAPAVDESAATPQTGTNNNLSDGKSDSTAMPVREAQVTAVADSARAAAPPRSATADQIALWVKRGEEFIAVGDFVSARVVFQRAAEVGNARAAFMLATTYDPNVLNRFQAKGLAADTAKARSFYEKSMALGWWEASRMLELLPGR
jgi:hypothetical protein